METRLRLPTTPEIKANILLCDVYSLRLLSKSLPGFKIKLIGSILITYFVSKYKILNGHYKKVMKLINQFIYKSNMKILEDNTFLYFQKCYIKK